MRGDAWNIALLANSVLAFGVGICTVGLLLVVSYPFEYVGEGCQLRQFGRVITCDQHSGYVTNLALALVGFAFTWVLFIVYSVPLGYTGIVAESEKTN